MNKRYRDILRTIEKEGVTPHSFTFSKATTHMHITCEYRDTTWIYITGAATHPSARKFKNVRADMRRAKREIDAKATRNLEHLGRRAVERGPRKLSSTGGAASSG